MKLSHFVCRFGGWLVDTLTAPEEVERLKVRVAELNTALDVQEAIKRLTEEQLRKARCGCKRLKFELSKSEEARRCMASKIDTLDIRIDSLEAERNCLEIQLHDAIVLRDRAIASREVAMSERDARQMDVVDIRVQLGLPDKRPAECALDEIKSQRDKIESLKRGLYEAKYEDDLLEIAGDDGSVME